MTFTRLINALSPAARITSVRALTGGMSAQVHAVRFTSDAMALGVFEHEVVVRQRPATTAWGERLPMEVEYRLLQDLHHAGLPVPRPRLLWPPDSMVMDFVEGTDEPPLDGEERMALALAKIHAQPCTSFDYLPEREDPVAQLHTLLPQPSTSQAISAFSTAASDICLLHGDFWPANLLWRQGELVAILDWEDAAVGDPLSDVACARLELWIKLGDASSVAFTAHYLSATKRDAARLVLWDLYVAAAALESMDQWGLEPAVLCHRRRVTQTFHDRALAALGAR